MSMSLDLPDHNYEMIELTGAWSRERNVKNRKLGTWKPINLFTSGLFK